MHFPRTLLHNNHPAVLIHVLFEVFFPSALLSVIPSLGAALTSAARLQLPPPRGSRAALCEDEETSLQVPFYLPSLRRGE